MGDLISRSAAIEAIDELVSTMSVCVSMEECKGMNWMKRRAIAAIRELPTAERVGKWILSDLQDENEVANGNFYYVCSCCGKGDTHAKSAEVPYCWWCGARMRGEEDE
jgi:hypothetical protein